MQLFNYIEINIIASVILLIIFLNIKRSSERFLIDQKIFISIIGFCGLSIVLDTIAWALNGQPGAAFRYSNITVTALYYIINPVPYMLWSVYVDYQINKDRDRVRKLILSFYAPLVFNLLLAVLSPFYRLLFYIDLNNIYHRGKLFFAAVLIPLYYIAFSFVIIIKLKSRINRRQYTALLCFAIPLVAGNTVQVLFYGISVIWISMAVSLLIIYINIQNNQLHTDYLTGLYNRRQLDNYLSQRIRNTSYGNLLAGIMIDLNSFKKINDIYGHPAGDQALEAMAKILKKSFRKDDVIARYGGDEFVVLLEINDRLDLINAINRVKQNTDKYNAKKILPYEIALSIGYDIFEYKSGMTIQQFFKHIDELMYEDKKNRSDDLRNINNL